MQPVASDDGFDDSVTSVNALLSDQGCADLNAEECREFRIGSNLTLLGA